MIVYPGSISLPCQSFTYDHALIVEIVAEEYDGDYESPKDETVIACYESVGYVKHLLAYTYEPSPWMLNAKPKANQSHGRSYPCEYQRYFVSHVSTCCAGGSLR